MEDKKEIIPIGRKAPDGSFDMKLGQTTYKVKPSLIMKARCLPRTA